MKIGILCSSSIYHVLTWYRDQYVAICDPILRITSIRDSIYIYPSRFCNNVFPFNINTICSNCLKLEEKNIKQFIIYDKLGIKQ